MKIGDFVWAILSYNIGIILKIEKEDSIISRKFCKILMLKSNLIDEYPIGALRHLNMLPKRGNYVA